MPPLLSTQQLYPPLACVLINTYRSPASLFVSGDTILSEEGTTQGNPLVMPMYAIAMIPLIRHLNNDVTQVAGACGRSSSLHQWWDQLCKFVEEKVKGLFSDVAHLAKVAHSQPHATYSAFTKGLASCWVYVSRTVPDIDILMQPLEDVIRCVLTGRTPPNKFECDLFTLPP